MGGFIASKPKINDKLCESCQIAAFYFWKRNTTPQPAVAKPENDIFYMVS